MPLEEKAVKGQKISLALAILIAIVSPSVFCEIRNAPTLSQMWLCPEARWGSCQVSTLRRSVHFQSAETIAASSLRDNLRAYAPR